MFDSNIRVQVKSSLSQTFQVSQTVRFVPADDRIPSLASAFLNLRGIMFRSKESKLKKTYFKRNGGLLLEQRSNNGPTKPTIFSSKELKVATDNFNPNRKLGKGSVFRATLTDGREVAVKRSKLETVAEEEVRSFINEVFVLSQVNHRNVVKLLGCCLETEVPLLVYEFVPKGDLALHLRDERPDHREISLSWDVRLRISVEIAEALSFLHDSDYFHFYHRDVKSANILLDGRHIAKLADFGMSKSVGLNQTHVTTRVVGTDGYLDPEYSQSSRYTDKSDVYSFGVVLVELLTGRIGTESIKLQGGLMRSLGMHFVRSVEENRLVGFLDERVKQEGGRDAIEAVASLAVRCLDAKGRKRPSMRQVGLELQRIRSLPANSD